jgi:DNA repair protein RecN (Recombination protein N)
MLTQLSIQNILLIKSCDIHFGAGLNTLTGETGAGKSILLDALGLVLGERGEAGLVRTGETNASVTAEFDITGHTTLKQFMAELDMDAEDTLVMRRTLTAEGKSRAFVNDAPVAVATLKKLGEMLIARHGQHDQRGLMDSKTHRTLLDAFGDNQNEVTRTAAAFAAYKQAAGDMEMLAEKARDAAREENWLRSTAAELTALDPQEGEEEALAELRKRASDAKASTGALREALARLSESGGVSLNLRHTVKLLAKTPLVEETVVAALERAEAEVEEVSVTLERLLSSVEIDPHATEQAEDRLHALRAAARKYNVAVALLPGLRAESEAKLATLTNLEADNARATRRLAETEEAYRAAAMALYSAREKAAEKLTKEVMKELKPLKMATTQLRVVQTELPAQSWGEGGMHQVQFEVATNAGMPFGALSKVASGGELSRLLLAMKVVLRAGDDVTAIFDEIDSGTGGAVAEAIGLRLKKLAEAGQVIVVTHLPQVAALASHHLYITKSGTKEVITHVKQLDTSARKEELARMLSGATISDEARKTAEKMLEGAA